MATVIESPLNIKKIGNINCSLELGSWTLKRIKNELIDPQRKLATANEKLCFLATQFIDTPFYYESWLPELDDGILRIRLETFDCVTYIYTVLALLNADSIEHFVLRLYQIRYKSDNVLTIKNNPAQGNIFDFACESLVVNATSQHILKDITEDVAGHAASLIGVSTCNLPFRRAKKYDPYESLVTPKYTIKSTKKHFILAKQLNKANLDYIQSGDLVFFTQGSTNKDRMINPTIINHLAFAMKMDSEIYFLHASMSFFQYLESERHLTTTGTGIFYDDQRLKQQAGINFGGEFIGGSSDLDVAGTRCYAYSPTQKRLLVNYAQDIFFGVAFYRPL